MEEAKIEGLIDSLYTAFCFDPEGVADWRRMRSLFADGANFVSPIQPGRPVKIVDADGFVADFKQWIETSAVGRTGLHERVTKTRIEVFANIAHAFVTFEGFVPGQEQRQTLGVDSLQLVLEEGEWKVASFSSQYTSPEIPLPPIFVPQSTD